jgi:hypothetical protein
VLSLLFEEEEEEYSAVVAVTVVAVEEKFVLRGETAATGCLGGASSRASGSAFGCGSIIWFRRVVGVF